MRNRIIGIVNPKHGAKGYKKLHWLPLLIKPGAKFSKMEEGGI